MRRCVFLDRDGVVNVAPPIGEYVTAREQFVLIPAIVDWIRLVRALGYLVIVVTNQRGVSRGLMSLDALEGIHAHMRSELAAHGVELDDVFACPHEIDACDCRKPKPGLVERARTKWNIDLTESLLVGDSDNDRQLARACGLTFVEVRSGRIVGVEQRMPS